MSDPQAQERRHNSKTWSEDVLLDRGFRRVGNTSIFKASDGSFILSPGVGPGGNGRYWFDLRDKNLNRVNQSDTRVMLRIVGHGFVVLSLDSMLPHLNDRTRRLTKAGPAYGFNCSITGDSVTLRSSSDATYSFSVRLLDRSAAIRELEHQL